MRGSFHPIFTTLTVALVVSVFLTACSQKGKDEKKEAPAAAAEKDKSEERVKHGTNGETIVALDAATQKQMGLEVGSPSPAKLEPEVKGYGRVLDAASLATQVADLAAAQATAQASQSELQRLKTLAAQNNASQRALQTAEATAIKDQAQTESLRSRFAAAWGVTLASHEDLPSFAQSLVSLSNALVQLNVPATESLTNTPTGARLISLANNVPPIEAQILGPAPMADPQLQGQGFLFLVSPNTAHLLPGAAITGYILLPGQPQPGLSVPTQAILRFNGAAWVYRQTSPETFERVELKLEQPLASGWFVREGLKPDDKLVTVGAQLLLSEELKTAGGQ